MLLCLVMLVLLLMCFLFPSVFGCLASWKGRLAVKRSWSFNRKSFLYRTDGDSERGGYLRIWASNQHLFEQNITVHIGSNWFTWVLEKELLMRVLEPIWSDWWLNDISPLTYRQWAEKLLIFCIELQILTQMFSMVFKLVVLGFYMDCNLLIFSFVFSSLNIEHCTVLTSIFLNTCNFFFFFFLSLYSFDNKMKFSFFYFF